MHLAARVALWHFLMQNPAPCGHPLHISSAQRAVVSKAIGMGDSPFEHIGDRFDPTVGVPGEALLEVDRPFVAEIIKQQERIKL